MGPSMSENRNKMLHVDRSPNATRTPQPTAEVFFVIDNVWDAVEKSRCQQEAAVVARYVADRWGHDTGNGGG